MENTIYLTLMNKDRPVMNLSGKIKEDLKRIKLPVFVTDRKEKKQEERRRGRRMRTARLTKIAMVIFLSMIFFLGVQKPVLAAGKNTTVKIPVEQIFEVNNSADADKTGSYVLIADQIQNPMPEGSNRRTFTWNMVDADLL